ncbi:tripeptidyl aminopeptidase [Apiospora kogelbergensis]|uniref:Tripeptidyl aminopeptidase n=1 Tax=Apiospora kogelbergensis TaxID=1337665 RepID=A0AAW0R6Q1_9PEZI
MVRLAATDPSRRIGPLFVNPGGPGSFASNAVAILSQAPHLDPEIRARFDIIGLDPRGVGLSTPLRCDAAAYNTPVKFFPETEEEFDALVKRNRAIGESCRAATGRLIDFVDTVSAARDHEAVRRALGDDKASFLGLSYGTELFATYAQLFPDRVRAMALDGILQHSQSVSSNLLTESTTYEATLKQFFAFCNTSNKCPLKRQDVQAVFTGLLAQAKKTPIPAPGCVGKPSLCRAQVSDEDILFAMQSTLLSVHEWPNAGVALAQAKAGNATLLSQRRQFATGASVYADSGVYSATAVACQDWAGYTSTLAELKQLKRIGELASPLTQGACQFWSIEAQCIGWPAKTTYPPAPIQYKGKTPLLLVNSLYDPSTSYTWAVGLKQELGDRAVLLTRNGAGHTSYLPGIENGGEAMRQMNAYLLELTLPKAGTVVDS